MSDPQRATFRVDRNAPGRDRRAHRRGGAATAARERRTRSASRAAALELRRRGGARVADARGAGRAPRGDRRRPRRPAPRGGLHRAVPGPRLRRQHGPRLTTARPPTRSPLRLPLRDTPQRRGGRHRRRGARGAAHATGPRRDARARPRPRHDARRDASSAGRRVEFQERIGAGEWRLRAVRVSDDTGRVVRDAAAPGTSRRIRLVVADTEQAIGAASRAVEVAVPARVTLRASRGEPAQRAGRPVLGPPARRPRPAARPRARAAGVQPAQGSLAAGAHAGPAHHRERALGARPTGSPPRSGRP